MGPTMENLVLDRLAVLYLENTLGIFESLFLGF